jgi:mannitol-specific phosphotransferase system IIBC component
VPSNVTPSQIVVVSSNSADKSNVSVLIGVIVGALVVIFLVVILIVVVMHYRKRHHHQQQQQKNVPKEQQPSVVQLKATESDGNNDDINKKQYQQLPVAPSDSTIDQRYVNVERSNNKTGDNHHQYVNTTPTAVKQYENAQFHIAKSEGRNYDNL